MTAGLESLHLSSAAGFLLPDFVCVCYIPTRVYVNCIANVQLRMEPSSGDSEADGE